LEGNPNLCGNHKGGEKNVPRAILTEAAPGPHSVPGGFTAKKTNRDLESRPFPEFPIRETFGFFAISELGGDRIVSLLTSRGGRWNRNHGFQDFKALGRGLPSYPTRSTVNKKKAII